MKALNQNIGIFEDQLIGKGSTGNVYLGQSLKDGNKRLAIKAIQLSEINNPVTQYLLSCEIVALSELAKIQHPNIVQLQDIFFTEQFCYLAMDILEGGPLTDYIKQYPNGIPEAEAYALFRQMFEGYKTISSEKIVHRDIKPDNIIFKQNFSSQNQHNEERSLSFIDFGYCTVEKVPNRPEVYYNVGSPKYMSPEAYRENIYSQKSDIWALGVVFFEMLHGKTMDSGMDMTEYMEWLRKNPIPYNSGLSPLTKKLLIGMLFFDYRRRLSCKGIQSLIQSETENQQGTLDRQRRNHPEGSQNQNNPSNYMMRGSPMIEAPQPTRIKSPVFHSQFTQQTQNQAMRIRNESRDRNRPPNQDFIRQSPQKMVHIDYSSLQQQQNRQKDPLRIKLQTAINRNNPPSLIQNQLISHFNQSTTTKNSESPNLSVIRNSFGANFKSKFQMHNEPHDQPPHVKISQPKPFFAQQSQIGEPENAHREVQRKNTVFRSSIMQMSPSANVLKVNNFQRPTENQPIKIADAPSGPPRDFASENFVGNNVLDVPNSGKTLQKSYSSNIMTILPLDNSRKQIENEPIRAEQVSHNAPLPLQRESQQNDLRFLRNTMPGSLNFSSQLKAQSRSPIIEFTNSKPSEQPQQQTIQRRERIASFNNERVTMTPVSKLNFTNVFANKQEQSWVPSSERKFPPERQYQTEPNQRNISNPPQFNSQLPQNRRMVSFNSNQPMQQAAQPVQNQRPENHTAEINFGNNSARPNISSNNPNLQIQQNGSGYPLLQKQTQAKIIFPSHSNFSNMNRGVVFNSVFTPSRQQGFVGRY